MYDKPVGIADIKLVSLRRATNGDGYVWAYEYTCGALVGGTFTLCTAERTAPLEPECRPTLVLKLPCREEDAR